MVNMKTGRSALLLLALCGMVAACGSKAGHDAPQVPPSQSTDGSSILSQEVTHYASVKIASITDDKGAPINRADLGAMAGGGLASALAQLEASDRAVIMKESVQADGQIAERFVIDLRDKADSIVKFHADSAFAQVGLASSRAEFPAKDVKIAMADGKISQMAIRLDSGRMIDVVIAFQTQTKQEQAKQEQAKQEQAKQEQAKQERAKQEQAKQEQAKQEQAKQEQAKQEQAKQEQVKQEQAKQEQVKQEQAKQEEVKQEQAKQEQVKQEEAKQEEVKQEQVKQEEVKQEQVKQEQVKQEQKK